MRTARCTSLTEFDFGEFEQRVREWHRGGWAPSSIPGRNAEDEVTAWINDIRAEGMLDAAYMIVDWPTIQDPLRNNPEAEAVYQAALKIQRRAGELQKGQHDGL